MVWVIVVVAIAVLGVAAWAGTGRLGEMPEAVTDRPKPHLPDGPVDAAFLSELSIPLVSTGYNTSQVDAHLRAHVEGETVDLEPRFDVVRRGYDMQAVDSVLELMASPSAEPVTIRPEPDEATSPSSSVPPDTVEGPPTETSHTTTGDLPAV